MFYFHENVVAQLFDFLLAAQNWSLVVQQGNQRRSVGDAPEEIIEMRTGRYARKLMSDSGMQIIQSHTDDAGSARHGAGALLPGQDTWCCSG